MIYLDQYVSLVLFAFGVWSVAAILGIRGAITPFGARIRKWAVKGFVFSGAVAGFLSFFSIIFISVKVWDWPWWMILPAASAQVAGMSFVQVKIMELAPDIWFLASGTEAKRE